MSESGPTSVPRRAFRATGRVALGTLLSRATGLVRVWATVKALGETSLADTYNSANATPNLVYELLLGGVLTATLVPLFVDLHDRDDRDAGRAVFTTAMVALLALSAVAVAVAPALAGLLATQVRDTDHAASVALGTALIRCFAIQIAGYGFTALAAAALNARGRFAAAALAPVVNNLVVSAVLLSLTDRHATLASVDGDTTLTLALGLGTTAGVVATALALLPALRRADVSLRPRWDPRHAAVSSLLRKSGWTVGYVVANQLALVVVLIVARETEGALAAYQWAFVFFQLPHGLIAVSIMTVWLPDLSARASRGDLIGMRDRFDAGLRALIVLLPPAAAGYLALSVPLVDTLLTTGRSSPTHIAAALSGFALGLVPFSAYLYTLRGFYALGDTRTPFMVNALENACNIAFAIPAFALWGVRGLAVAYSAAYLIAGAVALMLLRKRIAGTEGSGFVRLGIAASVASVASGAVAWAFATRFESPAAALAVGTVGGGSVYALVMWITARDEIRTTFAGLRPGPRALGADV